MQTVSPISALIAKYLDGVRDRSDLSGQISQAGSDFDRLCVLVDKLDLYYPSWGIGWSCDEGLCKRSKRRGLIPEFVPFLPDLISILKQIPSKLEHGEQTSLDWSERGITLARLLADMGRAAQEAVPALIGAMHVDQRGIGQLAGVALGVIGGDLAIRELASVWYSGWDRKLCESCDDGLEQLGGRAIPLLLRMIEEPDALTRARALLSLRDLGYPPRELIKLAIGVLESDDSDTVKKAAMKVLKDWGNAVYALPALPVLQDVVAGRTNHSEEIRELCSEAEAEITKDVAAQQMPSPKFGHLRWSLQTCESSRLFEQYRFERVSETPEAVIYRPASSQFAESVSIELYLAEDDMLTGLEFKIAREFLDGPEREYAVDFVLSFLHAAMDRVCKIQLVFLLSSIESELHAVAYLGLGSVETDASEHGIDVFKGDRESWTQGGEHRYEIALLNQVIEGSNVFTINVTDTWD